MTQNIQGMTVDVQAMADGLYAIITDRDQAALVAFGMLPADLLDLFEKQLGEKYEATAKEQAKTLFGCDIPENLEVADQAKKKAFVRDCLHEVSIGIYKAASNAGMMVV